jgi:hypothetical protein
MMNIVNILVVPPVGTFAPAFIGGGTVVASDSVTPFAPTPSIVLRSWRPLMRSTRRANPTLVACSCPASSWLAKEASARLLPCFSLCLREEHIVDFPLGRLRSPRQQQIGHDHSKPQRHTARTLPPTDSAWHLFFDHRLSEFRVARHRRQVRAIRGRYDGRAPHHELLLPHRCRRSLPHAPLVRRLTQERWPGCPHPMIAQFAGAFVADLLQGFFAKMIGDKKASGQGEKLAF